MVLTTKVTEILGIRIPVIQGGMQWVGVPVMVAAVSNAGGLGILTALSQPTPDALRKTIRETRKLVKNNAPFGVNITILPTIKPVDYEGYVHAAVEEGVKIFETAGRSPAKYMKYFKDNGCIVMHKCTSIRHAQASAKMGVDIISLDGFECAGHPGEEDIPGMLLLARAARELNIPYIASGGFADGRGLAAALALGAQGINMGTRFLATVEAPIHQNVKNTMLRSTEKDTIHIFRTLNNTARVFRNKPAQQVVALEQRPGGVTFDGLRDLVSGERCKVVYETGDIDAGVWTAGIAVGLVNDIPTCEVLLERIVREAEDIIEGLGRLKERSQGAKL